MGKGIESSGDPCVSVLSLDFAGRRSELEWSIVREILFDHHVGLPAAMAAGLTADHFCCHDDSRIVFLACQVARAHSKDVVLRLAIRALELENYLLAERLPLLAQQTEIPNTFMRLVWVGVTARKIITMDMLERDARAHYRQCCKLLQKGAAA